MPIKFKRPDVNKLLHSSWEKQSADYRYRKNELFKRMKVTTFAQLVLQVANIAMADEDEYDGIGTPRSEVTSNATLNGNHSDSGETHGDDNDIESVVSSRSTLQSVISGVGEADLGGPSEPRHVAQQGNNISEEEMRLMQPYPLCPYLVVDVRDQDEYDRGHIIGAINSPTARLSRTTNNFTREMLEYKNQVGKIIVLYDEDEKLATMAATTMVERGFDNIFIISGGLKVLGQKIPEGLITGTLPPSCVPAYIAKRLRNNRSMAEDGPIDASPNHRLKRFSSEELDRINHYLDESLVPNDTGSRLSRQSKASDRLTAMSKTSSMSSSSSGGSRRPWK
ncbi:centrosomal protein of 41 kDa-like isoform X2 [Styela clava]